MFSLLLLVTLFAHLFVTMSTCFNILAWNVRGVMSSSLSLSNVLDTVSCDIAIICEHKLKPTSVSYLDTINSKYSSFVHIDSEQSCNNTDKPYSPFVGKGGVGIMYRKDLLHTVSEIPDITSSRIIGIEVKRKHQRSLYVLGAYLPSDSNIQTYQSELNLLDALFNHLCTLGDVIIGGDLNASLYDKELPNVNQYKAKALKDFTHRNNICIPSNDFPVLGSSYTFLQTKTTLDFILCNRSFFNFVNKYRILEEGTFSSTSDHLPVLMSIDLHVKYNYSCKNSSSLPAWHKADVNQLQHYELYINNALDVLLEQRLSSVVDLDNFCKQLYHILYTAASLFIPVAKFKPHLRPEWTPEVKHLHDRERQMRNIWLIEGRPRGMVHDSYKNYKKAKREFRNKLNAEHDRYMTSVFHDIDQASECDVRLFWKLVKRQRPRNTRFYQEIEIDGRLVDNPDEIASCFAEYFEQIYNPTKSKMFDSEFYKTIENSYLFIQENSRLQTLSKLPGGEVTATEISKAIKDLKRRKAPGLDCIQNEHLIFGGPRLFACMSHLFNAVINIGRIPSIWKTDLIIPIYKGNNKTKSSHDSYRPIALLPCLMKLFEKILTLRIRDHVLPSVSFPNPQQQGFQPKLGCITASFNLQETVFHNLEQGSPVYVAFLDTQKAFDTVWRHGLMCKLHQLGVKGSLWTLIDDCHTDTSCSVAVNQKNSNWFPISQGVRQGGVLSTFLYLVFINDLLQELQNQNPNTGIHSIRSSNPALADDISCIALSPRGLQTLLNTAYDFSIRWRFKFNASKSNVLYFSPTGINNNSLSWKLGHDTIKISKSYNHLGILLDAKLDPTERTAKACRKGQQTYFALKISEHLNPATLSKLYKRIVLPSVLYGSELWCDLKQKDNRALDVFQHFICKHAMNLPKHTRSDMCESIFGLLPIVSEIDKRKLQLFGRLCLMDTKCLTKKIFLHRLFSYLDSPNCKHYGFIPDIIHLLGKYNLLEHLNSYLQNGLFLNKLEWKKTVNSAVFYHFTTFRSNRMLRDNDFTQFRHITGNSRPDWIWKLPSDVQEVTR